MGVEGEEPIASSSSSTTKTSTSGGVNVDMVKTLGAYQLAVFAGVMACSLTAAHVGHWDSMLLSMQEEPQQLLSSLGPRFLEGVFLCGAPMVAFYRELVERSSARDGSHVNFSTTNLVMTVFGRRQEGDAETAGAPTTTTAQAIGWGALLALVTAWSEEFVFRGMLQSGIYHWSLGSAGSSADVGASIFLAWAMQSIVFGLAGHTLVNHHLMMLSSQMQQQGNGPAKHQQAANFKNIEASHRMIMELQTAQAAWLGAVYFMTGGDLLPCIVGHFLYNMHVLVKTWHGVNEQMDWTEAAQQSLSSFLSPEEVREMDELKKQAGKALTPEALEGCCRFFYAFDMERRRSLSLDDAQRAVSYAFFQDAHHLQPSQEAVSQAFARALKKRKRGENETPGAVQGTEESQRLNLPEFLRLLFQLRAQVYGQKQQQKQQQQQQMHRPAPSPALSRRLQQQQRQQPSRV